MTTVFGYCPMGCGATLILGAGGHVTCGYLPCPDPAALNRILSQPETEHIVIVRDEDFTIRHPLRERVDEQLERCTLHRYAARQGPIAPGTYRVQQAKSPAFEYSWVRIDEGAGR